MPIISLRPTEQKRVPTVRREIVYRDKYCTFPFLINGVLEGVNITGKAKYGNVHHITPIHFLVNHRPLVDPNHPLNLFTLDRQYHNMIHREWVNRYGENPALIQHEVGELGKAGWVDTYDRAMTSIALIRSYDLIQSEPDKFPDFHEDIIELYPFIDPEFESRYRFFMQGH